MNPFIKVTNIKGEDLYLNVDHIVLFQKTNQGCQVNYHGGYHATIADDIDLLIEKIDKATGPRKCHVKNYPALIFTFHKFITGDGLSKAIIEDADGHIFELHYNEIVFINE